MFTYQTFKHADIPERRRLIISQAELETSPEGIATQLQSPFRTSKVINKIIDRFIDDQIAEDNNNAEGSVLDEHKLCDEIDKILGEYQARTLLKVTKLRTTTSVELQLKPKNLYTLAGASELTFANNASRHISTTMGPLWEKIAKISPYVVDPEIDFGIKIPGVDIILKNTESDVIEYAQLKTQRNTLTGGQSGRVDAEMSLHDNPIFCACFLTAPAWTYNTKRNIPRLVGDEFWGRIGIDYDIVLRKISELILSLEDRFVQMLGNS